MTRPSDLWTPVNRIDMQRDRTSRAGTVVIFAVAAIMAVTFAVLVSADPVGIAAGRAVEAHHAP